MKYYQTDELQKHIDWYNLMKIPRSAGGHDEQMIGLFKNSTLVAHWNENDYQGSVATCVCLNDEFIIYNDYYGSCSGCDSWEDAEDDAVKAMCINLSNGSYIFKSISDVAEFLKSNNKDSYSWDEKCSSGLLESINNNLKIAREIKIANILH